MKFYVRVNASWQENTTWDLVADVERLRTHLGIEKWVVFGGSWGSALGLAYSETHPDRVKGIIIRGIYTISRYVSCTLCAWQGESG